MSLLNWLGLAQVFGNLGRYTPSGKPTSSSKRPSKSYMKWRKKHNRIQRDSRKINRQ